MDHTAKLQQSVRELRRLTGLPLELSITDDLDVDTVTKQISDLCAAYKNTSNRESILCRWLLGNMTDDEFFSYSSRIHMHLEEKRGLFLIQLNKEADPEVITVLKNMFSDIESMVFSVKPDQLVMIRQLPQRKNVSMKEKAYEISNILSSELMMHCTVSYSNITTHLNQLPGAYQEATQTMMIGSIFYPNRTIYGYDEMGVGSLLFGLPKSVCMQYICNNLGEYYLENESSIFQTDILETADCFLRNNLNIAETARQLHIHRNTLLYRLEQIQNETGLDIRKFNAAMTYKLSSMILHYLRQE